MLGEYCGREERGQSGQGHTMLPVKPDPVLATVLGRSQREPGQLHQVLMTGHHGDWWRLEWHLL